MTIDPGPDTDLVLDPVSDSQFHKLRRAASSVRAPSLFFNFILNDVIS